jgi:H+/Cl- antiporter ClcA
LYQQVHNKHRLATQGTSNIEVLAVALGFIVYILMGFLYDMLENTTSLMKEGTPMKLRIIENLIIISKSVLFSTWTLGSNLLAGTLLAYTYYKRFTSCP